MSSKQLTRLGVALLVLLLLWGAAALARRSEGTGGSAEFALPKIDTAAIDTVAIAGRADTVVLTRAEGGKWRVNSHPAAPAAVTQLMTALTDTAGSSELVAQSASSHAKLYVTADSGQRLRVVAKGRPVADLIVGRRTDDYRGVYLRRADGTAVYAFKGRLPDMLTRGDDEWRDTTTTGDPPPADSTLRKSSR